MWQLAVIVQIEIDRDEGQNLKLVRIERVFLLSKTGKPSLSVLKSMT